MKWFQQGDVLIKPVRAIPAAARRRGTGVLAEGEATGHQHFAHGENVTTWVDAGKLYLEAPNGAEVTHEEHLPIGIPPGVYSIEIVREFDHFAEEVRTVRD